MSRTSVGSKAGARRSSTRNGKSKQAYGVCFWFAKICAPLTESAILHHPTNRGKRVMELELKKLEDTIKSIHDEMFYLREREEQMQDMNRSTNSRMAWLSFLSLAVCLSNVVEENSSGELGVSDIVIEFSRHSYLNFKPLEMKTFLRRIASQPDSDHPKELQPPPLHRARRAADRKDAIGR
ncbi:Transmembrane emp24 domain-containing protein [Musa troglodytarum]|uniref:Transmembrane emp24 domain-containing protein n=1 Tax=Musa troglodytarum TaxID=320322 RepID=A0A9E7ECU8_9LILI|nr:Transmembrane emp24 domain-containing protein [Musa troglodytarum]